MSTINREAVIDFVGSMEFCDEISGEAYQKLMNYLDELPSAQEEKWVSEIRETYERAVKNPYIRRPLSWALYEVWHRYDAIEVERR